MKDIKLKVMEALQEEVYKGIVRIDSKTMSELSVRPGDIIEIEGQRNTVGIVDRAYPSDIGQSIIRMDGVLRKNAKTGIGELVKVKKCDVKEAKSVTIAPAQKGVVVEANPNIIRNSLLGRPVMKGDQITLGGTTRRKKTFSGSPFEDIFDVFEQNFNSGFMGFGGLKFVVVNVAPKTPVIITENTQLNVNSKATEIVDEKVIDVTYEDVGGLTDEVKKVREMIELPMKHPELFKALGIQPPKGVLLHGPPGSGKTLLAKAVANETEANFMLVNGPEIMNKFYGESEKKVREIFDEAEKNAPTIIFVDEIDAIAPKRDESYGEVERRVVAQLLTMMDGLKGRGRVIVIGATNRPNALDPALRRPGRFDREISIGVPDKAGRLNILKIHTRNMPLTKDVNLNRLADVTHGFVGADVEALCKEAAMSVLRKLLPNVKLKENEPLPKQILEKLIINQEDFDNALKIVRPSAMREVLIETPNVHWDDVGGLDIVKQELKESVEWPLKHPKAFKKIGIRAPRGILIYGPPGSGKTLLAKAVAKESEANFILVKGPELLNKFIGESEKGIRKVFEKARQASPTVIFFDEIDALAPRRGLDTSGTGVSERVVNSLLSEMDGLEELTDVVILAATNRPDLIDSALLRPGRFDRIIATTVPNKESRLNIFKIHTKNMPLDKDVNLNRLVDATDNYSGADIEAVCREAGILALRDNIKTEKVPMKFFEEAVKKIKPSISEEEIKRYKAIEEHYLKRARGATLPEVQCYMG